MATRLAQGPATIHQLQHLVNGHYANIYAIVNNWVKRRYAQWPQRQLIECQRPGAPLRRKWHHIVTLTDNGRTDLWRYAQVTRRLRCSDTDDAPLRADMPEDPLEALRLYARQEFLRPAALTLLDELLGWPKQNGREMGAHTGNYGATRAWLDIFRKAGFVTDTGDEYPESSCIKSPHWIFNNNGREALDRHIDALRRAALASGFTPTRRCEYFYPREEASPCTWTMSANNPPDCPDCPYYWYVVQEQQREEERRLGR